MNQDVALHEWSKFGPESYFPSIEKKYGRSISACQEIIRGSGKSKRMEIVKHLKAEYGMGHANALVGYTLAAEARIDTK